MGLVRSLLLLASENTWLKNQIPKLGFLKKAKKRFIAGDNLTDAIDAAKLFQKDNITSLFTCLGENIADLDEAEQTVNHYLSVLDKIKEEKIDTEISIKLTQIGLDFSIDQTHKYFQTLAKKAVESNTFIWIDMESSSYVESTINFYKQQRKEFPNIGLCIQTYLFRTEDDLTELLKISPSIRLVKGAYKEPKDIAYKSKKDVDQNFFKLAKQLLNEIKGKNIRVAFATHDLDLIEQIKKEAESLDISNDQLEFQMLYGIKIKDQHLLASTSYSVRILISYGEAWFAWYMRRLAERPANIWFVMKNMFSK